MFHTQFCANGTKFVINGRMSISAWKTHTVFLRTEIVNISPATRDLRSSTACSVTAPCTAWSTAPGIPGISRKTAGGSRTAQAAPSHTIRSIMIRSCRSCGRIKRRSRLLENRQSLPKEYARNLTLQTSIRLHRRGHF